MLYNGIKMKLKVLGYLIIAFISYYGVDKLLSYIAIKDFLCLLQGTGAIIGGLGAAAFYLQQKLMELPSKFTYSVSEHNRIKEIISKKDQFILFFIGLCVTSSIVLISAPQAEKVVVDGFSVYYTMVSVFLFLVTLASFAKILLWIKDINNHVLKLAEKEAKDREKNRLLNKLNKDEQ